MKQTLLFTKKNLINTGTLFFVLLLLFLSNYLQVRQILFPTNKPDLVRSDDVQYKIASLNFTNATIYNNKLKDLIEKNLYVVSFNPSVQVKAVTYHEGGVVAQGSCVYETESSSILYKTIKEYVILKTYKKEFEAGVLNINEFYFKVIRQCVIAHNLLTYTIPYEIKNINIGINDLNLEFINST